MQVNRKVVFDRLTGEANKCPERFDVVGTIINERCNKQRGHDFEHTTEFIKVFGKWTRFSWENTYWNATVKDY